jgi:hypothetical protein
MSNKITIPAKTALIKQFNKAHGRFLKAATAAAPKMVKAINENRVMGIMLKELLGRENITENCLREWLRVNPNQLAETEVAWLMNFVRVSNKMQGELKLFADAPREVVQMTLQCAGLLPAEAGRDGLQNSHELTPSVASWKYATDIRLKFESIFKNFNEWDAETRQSVRQNIHKTKTFLDELESKL